MTTKMTRMGSSRVHALDVRVDKITSEVAPGSTPASTGTSPCSGLAKGALSSSFGWFPIKASYLLLKRSGINHTEPDSSGRTIRVASDYAAFKTRRRQPAPDRQLIASRALTIPEGASRRLRTSALEQALL